MTNLLVCDRVRRTFGGRRPRVAVHRCSFRADAGEIIGLVGPNGAGKTTLLAMLAGELQLSAGEVRVSGHRGGSVVARRMVGYASDPPLAPPELTGAEWLSYVASHRAASGADRARRVATAVEIAALDGMLLRRTATYSRGTRQRLALAAAVLGGERVVLLDETLSGIDPLVHRVLRDRITRLAGDGRLVVIASHDLAALERIATRVLVLWAGHLVADVSVAQLIAERVAELTLSGSGLSAVDRLAQCFPDASRTGQGVAIPLRRGLTLEGVLATCRDARVAVAGSRVRYRALEDILVAAAQARGGP